MLRLLLLGFVSLWVFSGWCQPIAGIVFHKTVADLGTIVDNQGVVTHRFEFINHGPETARLDKVEPSCGCTTSAWTKTPIAAGDKGYVDVVFDPHNRPGPFDKSILVFANGSQEGLPLYIRGFVKPAPASIEEEFPVSMGQLRVKKTFLDLGNITNRALYSKSFEIYNQSRHILVFSDEMEGPDHITIAFEPYTLKPMARGKMWVHYDVRSKKDLGYFREDVSVFTYESEANRKDFTVATTLLDLPGPVFGSAPQAHFRNTTFDFGIRQQGDTVRASFPFSNTGQMALHLKKAFGNCNCIEVQTEKTQLAPGDSSAVRVKFLTVDRLGNQQKTVTVFTDDPQQPVQILTIKGLVRGTRD